MDWVWDEGIWCPPGLKWTDYPARFNDIYYSLITAIGLLIMRYIVESTLFRPIGQYVCPKRTKKTKDGEPVKIQNPVINQPKLAQNRALVKKFSEGLWRFTFYLSLSIYGWFFVLWDKPYLRDTMHSLYHHPHHPVTTHEWWYYNIELGFYISLVITQFFDTKRKDFWQMFVHHLVTILLLVLSWACNFHRIGCLVIAIHDIGDIPLEAAKLAKYCEKQRLADLIFAVFTAVWIYTRCYLLPARVIYYTSYKALSIIPFFPAYYIFNGLLCLLQFLHIVWTYVIIKMVFDALQNDGMRDLRSGSEDDSEDGHED